MKAGDTATLNITDIAAGGDGVGKLSGMTVFVPQTCRGDRVEIQLTHVKSAYAYGKVTKILEASPHRREDFCPYYQNCGGCDFAHMAYAEQLSVKRQIVADAISRIGGFSDVPIKETLAAPKQERYRNKMVFPLGTDEKAVACGGFYAPGSHDLIPLDDCRQGDSAASRWLSETVSFLNEHKLSVYDEATHKGLARRLFVRLAEGTKEAMVALTINGKILPHAEELAERLLGIKTDFTLKSILLNIHKEPNNLLLGKENKLLFGREYIVDTLGDLRFHISPHSFYQVNPLQTENLYQTALDLAELSGTEAILDLYCGIGTISLFAAKSAGRVIGVEVVPQAIQNAKENAQRNNIQNAEFILGKAEDVAPSLAKEKPAVIFLDPPRKGADQKALGAILTMAPEKAVYISCNPATLARDLAILCEKDYEIKTVIPVDMFPNTSHVECVVLMSKVQK